MDASKIQSADINDSKISLEERLRRERQRTYATGVTQFCWSAVRSPSSTDSTQNSNTSNYHSNGTTSFSTTSTYTCLRGTTEVFFINRIIQSLDQSPSYATEYSQTNDASFITPSEPVCLTHECGMHNVVMDRYCRFVVDIS